MICVTNNRILIVYKNRELVNDIYTLYPDDTLNIITARSSIEALSKISFQLPNLIISEYDLENENGIDFCVKIRSSIKTKLIPFIIISDHDDHSENIRALQNGADAFLVRPFNDEELRAHIDNKISHYNDFYQLSIRDELTNLYNRREFINQFQYITSKDPSMVVSVAMVDIDFFKHVNDIHGHQVGDFVLMKFAETLQKFSYQSIIPTRFGGEEFAILLPGRDVQEAYEIIESIRKDFLSISFTGAKGNTFHVSFSTGIASYPDFADNISDILSLADQALYSAKKDGRGRTYIYKKHMSYNDRFWEYFEQTSNFYVDAHNNDAVTGLPFLPKLLEFLTTMSENINSIGVLTVNIEPLEGIRKYYGSHIYEIIIQNIKSVIEKVCYREYASETYFSISSFLEFGFTILFPSLFDFTLNSRKCHQLFMDITRQVDNELTIYPVEITSSDGVIYYANNNRKHIQHELSIIARERTTFSIKEIPADNPVSFVRDNYTSNTVHNALSGKSAYTIPAPYDASIFIPELDLYLAQKTLSEKEVRDILTTITSLSETGTMLVPFFESYDIDGFFTVLSDIADLDSVIVLFTEQYCVQNLEHIIAVRNKFGFQLGISNCYISQDLLKILSAVDFSIILFTRYMFYNLHYNRNRIKLLSGLLDFVKQLHIPCCVPDIVKSKDIHYVHALQIDYYSAVF